MSGTAIAILVIVILLALLFIAFQVGQAAAVRVESGTVGLMIVRGVATEQSLEPGLHFVMPYRKYMIQGYPLREMTYLTVAGGVAEATDYADELMPVRLGDRTQVAVGYTVRFKIRPDGLPTIHERVGNHKCYVSFDIDFLDPAFAPGTGTPVVGGFTTHDALQLIRGLGGLNIVGMDVVEVSPPYDQSELTALAGASIAQELLAAYASRFPDRI